MNTETHQFQAEVRQLLDIVINALYSDREIFVRELVSNASDALEKLRLKQLTDSNIYQPDKPLEITVTTDKENKTITIADTGIGMTEADLVENLGTIAHSGTKKFMEALKQKQEGGADLIGQFGVGFYSSFMVADRVEVFTHSYEPEAASLRWSSDGREGYSIETLAEPLDRGTRIVIRLKDEYEEFSQEYRVKAQDEIHGSLLEQVDKTVELLYLKYMKAKITYEGMQRIERYFVPEEALREALLNALCHKQYQSGIPIQISVYEDKLYIANCGSLPENWTMENLLSKHASKPYNPNLAHVFYLTGFIESWGRGIEKICVTCKTDGLPQPEYVIHPDDIMIKFTAPQDRIVHAPADRVNDRVNEKVNDWVNEKVNDMEKDILYLLEEDPGYTLSRIAEKLEISRKTVAQKIKILKEKGKIERIGSARKGYWEIKSDKR